MSEENRSTATDEPKKMRVTLAFRRARPRAIGNGEMALSPAPAAADRDDERMMLLGRLEDKSLKLLQSEGVLQSLYDSSTDAQERRELDRQIDEAWSERQLCDSRRRAIANNGPFTNPGEQADEDLLDAINAVDAAIRNSAAVGDLLRAVHGLVKAFPANSTRA